MDQYVSLMNSKRVWDAYSENILLQVYDVKYLSDIDYTFKTKGKKCMQNV